MAQASNTAGEAARMRVLLLQYTVVTGGAGFMAAHLASALARDHDVELAAYAGGSGAPASHAGRARVVLLGDLLPLRAMAAPYDYVHAAYPLRDEHCRLLEGVLAACPGAALAIQFHSEAEFVRLHADQWAARLVAGADALLVHHEAMRDELAALFPAAAPGRWRVIAPGVDVLTFRPGGTDLGAVREYQARFDLLDGRGRRRLVVAMAGRPSPEKNWLDYLLVCRRLKDALGERVACLAVTGPQRGWGGPSNLRRIAQFNSDLGAPARITGLLADWANLLASVDVYVQTSCSESFCRTAAEAAACGAPVVATAVGGLAALAVRDDVTGVLVRASPPLRWNSRLSSADREAFYQAVRAILASPNLRQRLGMAARRHAEERLDERECVEEHRRLVAELTDRP